MNMENKVSTFVKRLEKIGIKVELFGNYPWIYLDKVNGVKVKSKFQADHGFTIAFSPVKIGGDYEFTDLERIFQEVRDVLKMAHRTMGESQHFQC